MNKRKKNLPKTTLGRAGRLLAMSSTLVTREVANRIKNTVSKHGSEALKTRVKQAQDLVDTLGQLKGAAMKAGQLLSLEISDLLPPEVSDILRQLHDQAPPADISVIREMITKDLGDKANQLENLSEEPIASASIGQVHSAEFDGQRVAVKVQYPGIAGSINSDLSLLRRVCETTLSITGKTMDLGPLFEELRTSLIDEVDYRKEAQSLQLYKACMTSSQYIIPSVHKELSGEHVLTMSYEDGMRINDWLKRDLKQEHRDQFGHLVVQLVLDEFFVHGLVQTDPNYGNFLYRQGTKELVLLDFGATKSYTTKFRIEIRELLKKAYDGDREGILNLISKYKFLDDREDEQVKNLLADIIEDVISSFRESNQPFSYDDPSFLNDLRNRSTELVKAAKFSPPARQIIFLNRKLGGMFHLLKEAKCQINLHPYWLNIISTEIN